MRGEATPTTRLHLTEWRERGAVVLRGNFVVNINKLEQIKNKNGRLSFDNIPLSTHAVNLSNSFIKDLVYKLPKVVIKKLKLWAT